MEYVYDRDAIPLWCGGKTGLSGPGWVEDSSFMWCEDFPFAAAGETGEGEEGYPVGFGCLPVRSKPRRLSWLGASRLFAEKAVMVCGARNASEEGCGLAYRCGRILADTGYVISSGYARGVDLAAHRGALDAGGETLAFLPYGIARFRVHREIGSSFDPERFLAVSELAPRQVFSVHAALRRNKLLVALSRAVIVVEPGKSGGSWYSAEKACEMGKPLYYLEGCRPDIIPVMKEFGGIRLDIRNGAPDLSPLFGRLR